MYPLRTCNLNLSEKNIQSGKFKVCLEFHIGNCKGPCEARQSREDYDNSIAQIRHILKGNLSEVIHNLKQQMQEFAAAYRFEEAEQLKKKLAAMQDYQSKSLVVHPTITNVDVFSFREDEKNAYVNCMRIVNGSVIQTRTVEIIKKIEEEKEELFVFVIHELRNQLQSNSAEIIVPFPIEFPAEGVTVTLPSRVIRKNYWSSLKKIFTIISLPRRKTGQKIKRNRRLNVSSLNFRKISVLPSFPPILSASIIPISREQTLLLQWWCSKMQSPPKKIIVTLILRPLKVLMILPLWKKSFIAVTNDCSRRINRCHN
jgi:excinuclease ABC subunit C